MPWSREEGIIGDSPAMRALSERVARVASSNLPVLISGETGTGKELIARTVHTRSARRKGPFISENCAALSESLLEAELFGHESGSFTGATSTRDGLFARANGGTLFIDEIGDMSPGMQAKLLRVLQEGEVRRVGGSHPQPVDVRIVAATHRDLQQLVDEGTFRQDLLFRLAVLEVHVPPLRERVTDIPRLAERALMRLKAENGTSVTRLGEEALDRLLAHSWPGNVRELENAVRVGALFSGDSVIDPDTLPINDRTVSPRAIRNTSLSYEELLGDLETRERDYVATTLKRSKGNKAEAARRLGITRYALYRTMRRLGIDPDADNRVGAGSERLQAIAV